MSSEVYDIHIYNETTFTLHRHLHNIRHGSWKSWLPERILSGSDAIIFCHFNRPVHNHNFMLQYGVIIDGLRYVLCIKLFKTPNNESFTSTFELADLLDDDRDQSSKSRRGSRVVSDNSVKICKVHNEMHTDQKTQATDQRSKHSYIIRIQETTEGASYIKVLRERLNEMTENGRGESERRNANNSMDSQKAWKTHNTPSDFSWNIDKMDWIPYLRKSHRSVLVRIVNLTRRHMKLVLQNMSTSLEDGHWAEFPSEDIPSLCGTEFGVKSIGFFGGTCGKCTYMLLGESGTFTFCWEQPSMGQLSASGIHSKNTYSVVKHTESFNEAIVVFHVLDMSPPTLCILMARALEPSLIGKGFDLSTLPRNSRGEHIFDSLGCGRSSNGTTDGVKREAKTNSPNVTAKLLKYYENSLDTDHNLANTEFFIRSPRSFFSTLKSEIKGDILGGISYNSLLYLEWGIGNERFSKIFQPDEKVHIRSSVVGGIPDKPVIINAYLLRPIFDQSDVFGKHVYSFQQDEGEDSDIAQHLGSKARPFLRSLEQPELLGYVMMIFHSLCDGIQPFIAKSMAKRFGTEWIELCRVPAGHVWKIDDKIHIDIEGIIYIVTAYWLEIFEEVMEDSVFLHVIQTAAIYWANQELYRFDTNYVWDILEAAQVLLKKLRATDAIKHIEFISNKLIEQ